MDENKNFTKSIFEKIKISYPQNLETKKYLKKINSTKINQIGNLKFIENKLPENSKEKKKLKK